MDVKGWQMTKRQKVLIASAVCLIAVILLIFSLRSCSDSRRTGAEITAPGEAVSDQEDISEENHNTDPVPTKAPSTAPAAAEETGEADPSNGMCLITILNGAASANTKEAVNGLHVYDPGSEELDDFISGAQVPVGTEVCVYAYNLASPVSMVIEHNGEVLAERTYPVREAWVDDDKVEFFEITLEGDLTVTTEALPGDAEEPSEADDAEENRKKDETHSSGGDREAAQGAADEPTEKPAGKPSENDPEETSFSVTIRNNVSGADGLLTIGYVNEAEQAIDIVSGNKYKKGLYVGARVLNYSGSRKLRLTAYNGSGGVIQSVTAGTGSRTNPGASGFYLTLESAVTYVLDYGDAVAVTSSPKPTNKPAKATPTAKPGRKTTPTPKPGRKATPTPKPGKTVTPAPTKKPLPETVQVKVRNKAASANTDEYVNGLHVYDLNDPDLEDITGTAEKKTGDKIRIFAYPLASDIHLKIIHNKKTIIDKDIKRMKAWVDDDKIEFIDVTLQGDLKVTATLCDGKTPTKKPTPTPTKKPTPTPTKKPTPTPTKKPTPTPTKKPTPTPTKKPTPTPTKKLTPIPTEKPTPTESPEPTVAPEPSESPEPTAAPEPSGSPEPTAAPEPSGSPEPTAAPEPSESPEPTAAPEPSDVPEPTAAPEPSEFPEPTTTPAPTETPEPTEAPEPEKYTVTITNTALDSKAVLVVGWVDESSGTPKQVVLSSGDTVEKGTIVGAMVNNEAGKETLVLRQMGADGKVRQQVTVEPGSRNGIYVDQNFSTGIEENISFILSVKK